MPVKNGIQVVTEVRKFYELTRLKYEGIVLIEPEYVFLTAFSTD